MVTPDETVPPVPPDHSVDGVLAAPLTLTEAAPAPRAHEEATGVGRIQFATRRGRHGVQPFAVELLLSPATHPLTTMQLWRVQLTRAEAQASLHWSTGEALLYPLIGHADVVLTTEDAAPYYAGAIGGRASVHIPPTPILRLVPGVTGGMTCTLTLRDGAACDLLVVHTTQSPQRFPLCGAIAWQPAWEARPVGLGTYHRVVTDFVTPPGYGLHVGETQQGPGMISSWPPHATPEDVHRLEARQTSWEECFFCITAQPATAVLDGLYSTGWAIQESRRILNGSAHAMPLGAHRMQAAPDSALWYWWGYIGTALTKQYNVGAHDVGVYVK